MNNRHSMSLLGIPAGDIRAFKRESGQIKVFNGGSQPTSTTVTNTTVPEWLRPQVESIVGSAAGLMEGELDRGFQPFQGQRIAGFSPMQAQAFENVAGQQVAPQLADASNMAYGAGSAALGFGARGSEIGQEAMRMGTGQSEQAFGGAQQYGGLGSGFGIMGAAGAQQAAGSAAGQAQNFGSQAAGVGSQYARMATDPNQIQSYMSPYMQNVVDVQQQEAMRQADIQRQTNQSQAVSQGAFGGSRQGVVEAEAQRNLATQLGRIQAEGSQRAFEQAKQSQQFGAGLGLQGLQAGLQGVGQQISAGQLGLSGARTGIEGAQTGLQGVGQQISAGQLGQQAAGTALQGAGLGISGAQAATSAANQLGQLGSQQFEQQMGISDAMQKYGALQQAQQQAGLDVDYQNYLAAQNHPFSVIGLTSDIIRGHQASDTSKSVYGSQPDPATQLTAGLVSSYAASQLKAGGQVKRYQDGGEVSADAAQSMDAMELPSQLRRLSDSQLAAYARTVKDAIALSAIQSELSRRAKARQPASQAPQGTTAEGIAKQAEAAAVGRPRVSMYGGGIVALSPGGGVPSNALDPLDQMRMQENARILPQSFVAPNRYGSVAEDTQSFDIGKALDQARITVDQIKSNIKATYPSRRSIQASPQGFQELQGQLQAAETHRRMLQKQYEEMMSNRPETQPATLMDVQRAKPGVYLEHEGLGVDPNSLAGKLVGGRTPESTGTVFPNFSSGLAGDDAPYTSPQIQAQSQVRPPSGISALVQGAQQAMTPSSDSAPVNPPTPSGLSQPDEFMADATTPVGIAAAGEGRRQNQAPPKEGPTQGAMPSFANMSFDQWRQASKPVAQSPEDIAVLDDMKARVDSRMARAEGQENTAKFNAILMGGLAMMSGTSFADGLAKAAQTGGATFLAGKKDAAKAVDAAEDAELAFNQYKLALRKGDEKAAQSAFENYMNFTAKMAEIGAYRDAAIARAQPKPMTKQQEFALRANVERLVDAKFSAVIPSSDPNTAAQQERDKQNFRDAAYAEARLSPLQVQSGGGAGGADPSGLASTIK